MALWVRLGCSRVFLGVCSYIAILVCIYSGVSRPCTPPRSPVRLYAPVRARVPAGVPARLCAPACAPLALLGFPWRFYSAVASPRRACAFLGSLLLALLGFSCASQVLASFRFYTLLHLPLSLLLHALGCASASSSTWHSWRSYFVRRWRYHSFILLHSASYSFFLTHVHLKLSYINHIFSVYL